MSGVKYRIKDLPELLVILQKLKVENLTLIRNLILPKLISGLINN
jgi:hypothetical protein